MILDLPPKLWLPPKPAIIRQAKRELATFPFPSFVPFAGAGAPALTTLTQVLSATSTTASVVGPSGIVAGDLLTLWDRASGVTTPASVVPSGFNILAAADTSPTRIILSWKLATGAEASASLTGMNGALLNGKVLLVFRGDIPISVVTGASAAAQVTDANPSAQVVTSSGGTPPLVVVAGYSVVTGTVDPRTMSPAKDGEVSAATSIYQAWKIYNSSPANVTVDMDDEGTGNGLASGYLFCS